MKRSPTLLAFLVSAVVAIPVIASGQDYTQAENPYQAEYDYRLGSDLRPMVEVAGVRWNRLSIQPKKGKDLVGGKAVPTIINLELENRGDATVEILAAVLLENEGGNQLANLKCSTFKVGAGRIKEHRQKLKVDGAALRDTRKIWVFLEVVQ